MACTSFSICLLYTSLVRAIEKTFYIYFGELGNLLYLSLFITAIIVANIPSFIKHRYDQNYNSLGASGGVSALVLAFILFDPLRDLCLYALLCLLGYILGVLFIIYSIVMSRRARPYQPRCSPFWSTLWTCFYSHFKTIYSKKFYRNIILKHKHYIYLYLSIQLSFSRFQLHILKSTKTKG